MDIKVCVSSSKYVQLHPILKLKALNVRGSMAKYRGEPGRRFMNIQRPQNCPTGQQTNCYQAFLAAVSMPRNLMKPR